ncbi:MAG: TonB-dependent receptor plug domain-containing protein, partial [Sandarakinorhabdus sp.]
MLAQFAAAAPPLVVTASRLPPVSAPIRVDAETLESSGSVASALAGMPNLFIAQAGGRSGFAAATLDGADPNFTLVLFDGVPINNATSSRGGAINLAEIGSFGLAGIDLLPAQLSAVHGSGALAGVLAITPRGPADRVDVAVQGGGITRGGQTLAAGVSGPIGGGWGASLTGQIDNDGTPTPLARFVARTAVLRVVRDHGGDRLLLRFNDIDSAGFPDASGGALLATRRLAETRRAREFLAAVRTRQILGAGLVLDLNANWLGRSDMLASPGVARAASNPNGLPASMDETRYDRLIGQASLAWTAGTTQIAAGIEGSNERGRSSGELDFGFFALPTAYRLDRAAWAGFAEIASRAGAMSGQGALRVDRIGSLKARLSGRVAAAVDLGDGWRVETSAGSSFKAPSFYALANPLVPIRAVRDGDTISWQCPARPALLLPDLDERLYRLLIELQLATHHMLAQDVMGAWCQPVQVDIGWPAPDDAAGLAAWAGFFGVAPRFGAPQCALHYPVGWLDRAPQLANAVTAAQTSRECARLLESLEGGAGYARRVYREL